jgi:uncharacterized protein
MELRAATSKSMLEVALTWLVPLGIVAGALTTLTGMGGGMLLVVALSLLTDPLSALVSSAPALLVGNSHRVLVYRRHVVHEIARPLCLGALAGSLTGGLLAARLPHTVLQLFLAGSTALGILRVLGWIDWRPPRTSLAPSGFVIGALAATSGGAGLLMSPVMLSTGLRSESYVSTIAATAVAMHVGRIVSYAASGLFDAPRLTRAAVLAASIFAGNLIAVRIRAQMAERAKGRLELATLVVCVTLAIAGFDR